MNLQASLEVSGVQVAARKVLEEKHEVLMKAIFSTVMDFRVAAPQRVGACIALLHKMMANIVASPEESKFRQVHLFNRQRLPCQDRGTVEDSLLK